MAAASSHRPIAGFITALMTLTLSLTGCAISNTSGSGTLGPPDFGPDLRRASQPGSASHLWERWLAGALEEPVEAFAALLSEPTGAGSREAVMAHFGHAEALFHQGRVTEAAAQHAQLLIAHPAHPLARWSAQRLWEARTSAAKWPAIAAPAVEALQGDDLSDTTRAWRGRLALALLEAQHQRSGEAAAFDGAAVGHIQHWRMVGPVSLLPFLDHDTDFQRLEADAALADEYTFDGFTRRARDLQMNSAAAPLPVTQAGVYYFESWVTLPDLKEVLVQLECAAGVKLWIDDALVFQGDLTDDDPRRWYGAKLKLTPGLHRLRVRLALESVDEAFALQLLPGQGPPTRVDSAATTTTTDTAALSSAPPAPSPRWFSPLPAIVDHPFVLWLSAEAARDQGDVAHARKALARLSTLRPDFAPGWTALGTVSRDDPTRQGLTRRDDAMTAFREALDRDEGAGLAAARLAGLLTMAGQDDDALALLDAVSASAPDEPAIAAERYQLLLFKGWNVPARAALTQALTSDPGNCRYIAAQWQEWSQEERWPSPDALPQGFLPCDVTQEHLAMHHDLPRGQLDQAIARLEALLTRHPAQPERMISLATLMTRAGQVDAAKALFERAASAALEPAEVRARQLDVMGAALEPAEVAALLKTWRARHPSNASLARLETLARGQLPGQALRVDGDDVIKRFLEAPTGQDASAVYLLDYAATRVYPDGDSMTLTHIIVRVNNKAGIDAFGELNLPDGALPLRVRTVKPDGRGLEPELIPNKPNISMPNLAEGDFIEYEYLEMLSGGGPRAGTYEGIRFFFNIFDAPLLRSEYLVELPLSEGDDGVHIDRRNGAPAPTITEQGAWRRYQWRVNDAPRATSEPSAPSAVETLPSIRLTRHLKWADVHRLYRDRVLASARPNDALRAVAARLARDHRTPLARTRAAFAEVIKTLDDDGSGVFAQSAGHAFSAGQGDRLIVLKALLDAMSIPNEVVLARSWDRDQTLTEAPEVTSWRYTLLRVTCDGQELWLDPTLNHAPFNHLPPDVQGNKALSLGPVEAPLSDDKLFIDLPRRPTRDQRRVLVVRGAVDASGNLEAIVEDTYKSHDAAQIRRVLDEYTDFNDLADNLAQVLSPSFPNLAVTNFSVVGRHEPTAPLTLIYTVRSQGFARVEGQTLVVERPFYATHVAANYAALPERRLPVSILSPVDTELRMRLTFPDGARLETLSPQKQDSDFGLMDMSPLKASAPSEWAFKRLVRLPIQRVSTDRYDAFKGFARQLDELEVLKIRAALR